MPNPTLQTLDVNGLRMQVAIQGRGPLVLLCHGFPELWISWRAQLSALAAAGYRAVAPDMRGYGGTTAPEDPTAYTLLHLEGDMGELGKLLGVKEGGTRVPGWGGALDGKLGTSRPLFSPEVVVARVHLSQPRQM